MICVNCAKAAPAGRRLPPTARSPIRSWLIGEEPVILSEAKDLGQPAGTLTDPETKAHKRLLREFVHHHLSGGTAMKAFDAWEAGAWGAA